jgi:hypothetical protein
MPGRPDRIDEREKGKDEIARMKEEVGKSGVCSSFILYPLSFILSAILPLFPGLVEPRA